MNHIADFPVFQSVLEENSQIVYLFGTGISASLTDKSYGWWKWINDGINLLKTNSDPSVASVGRRLETELKASSSTENMIKVAGDAIASTKSAGIYDIWMHDSFEVNHVTNIELQKTLQQMLLAQDLFITTNYDYLLEEATGLKRLTYEDADKAYSLIEAGSNDSLIHIHGAYDSMAGLDNIIASREQYESIVSDKGAQFIQNILGTRSIIFIGCGKTSEDANISQFITFAQKYLKLDQPYFFLCREGDEPHGLPSNTRVIPYGQDFDDLTPFLKELAETRNTGFFLGAHFVGRNAYRHEQINNSGLSEYHFMQEKIPFCGRDKELTELYDFLNDDRKNLWWIISGQAGAGKSRLALELLKRLKNPDVATTVNESWFGFFLNKNANKAELEQFVPFRNTVIIVDYIIGNENHIGETVECLNRIFSKSTCDYKLRLLFIEREKGNGFESWIDEIQKSIKNISDNAAAVFANSEYNSDRSLSSQPLELFDMDDISVEKMIGMICTQHGLPTDHLRDRQLREEYHDKFEMLHYRPLFVEMFVEAWIGNDCVLPRYDTYKDLLKIILRREQDRWLVLCKNDYDICNAWISLVVLASCVDAIKVSELEGEYRESWNKIQKFIKSNTFAGEQREKSLEYLVDAMCQKVGIDSGIDGGADSDDTNDKVIHPLYPDILKEFMVLYYLDDEARKNLAELLWDEYPRKFATFVSQCISDFPYDSEVFDLVDKCRQRESCPEVLVTRAQLLKNSVLNFVSGDTRDRAFVLIRREDEFWHEFDPEKSAKLFLKSEAGKRYIEDTKGIKDTEDKKSETEKGDSTTYKGDVSKDIFGILKFNGLILVAEQYGGWSNVPTMVSITEEALDIDCGPIMCVAQISRGMDVVRNLEEHGFHSEANEISGKINSLVEKNKKSDFDIGLSGEVQLVQMNNEFMQFMLNDRLYDGYRYLQKMRNACGEDVHAFEVFAHSCSNLADISFIEEQDSFINRAEYLLKPIYDKYPDNSAIASNYVIVLVHKLQAEFFHKGTDKKKVDTGERETIDAYLSKLHDLDLIINGLEYSEYKATAWAYIRTFMVNFLKDDRAALQNLIIETDKYLDKHPYASEAPQVYISAVSALHQNSDTNPVSKEEIDKAYSYMLRFPQSENLRRCFFSLLEISTEADHKERYLPKKIRSEINNDRMYNPMYLPGIDDVDINDWESVGTEENDSINGIEDMLREFDSYGMYDSDLFEPQEPFRREKKKIMPNDPCPCGSGKKFKKCCKGKGIYD